MTKYENGNFVKRDTPFSMVSNSTLRDINLSLKAKGLYGLIQSYITIPGFTLNKTFLMKNCKEKNKAFDSAWTELKTSGYLKQRKRRIKIEKCAADSGFNGFIYEYDLLDEPDINIPYQITIGLDGEVVHNENLDDKIVYLQKVGGTNYTGFKQGGYNNTNLNNTNLLLLINKYSENENVRKSIKDFIEMRNKTKEPLTDSALNLVLKELDKLATDDEVKIEILQRSIVNNWKFVHPLNKKINMQPKNQSVDKKVQQNKNRFHNFESEIKNYNESELEVILEEKNKKKLFNHAMNE